MSDIADKPLTSLAFCWRLERLDGAGLALTSHDEAIEVDGVRYEAAPGMTPAAIRRQLGLEAGGSEVGGSLTSDAISEEDLLAGRWDGAALSLFAIDWEDPNAGRIDLLAGELGQVESKGGKYSAELLGAAAKLEQPICPATSPECRAELGDPKCRLDMTGRTIRAVVVSVTGETITLDRSVGDDLLFGRMRVLGGPANGLTAVILGTDGNAVRLRSAFESGIAPGTVVELTEGCDKRLQTCATRFANAANFRGEPHLPGNDLLTRYPGG